MNYEVTNLYDQDFYLWLKETTTLLKQKKFDALDIDNLVEELEAMGKSQKRELFSRLTTIIEHLLKLMYWESEKELNSRGWINTIYTQRQELTALLADSPSLKKFLLPSFVQGYDNARKRLVNSYNLTIPEQPCISLEQVLDNDWLP